ncbi:MAG TPA: hypothetical protein VJ929_11995 [Roseovarius sp.]|nr:hypothetical protein [Roseovarius sp.]
MPDTTHDKRLHRFNRLFELIRQRDAALAVQHRLHACDTTPSLLSDEHQAFVADAVASLQRRQRQTAIF